MTGWDPGKEGKKGKEAKHVLLTNKEEETNNRVPNDAGKCQRVSHVWGLREGRELAGPWNPRTGERKGNCEVKKSPVTRTRNRSEGNEFTKVRSKVPATCLFRPPSWTRRRASRRKRQITR